MTVLTRAYRSLRRRAGHLATHPLLDPRCRHERGIERSGGHPVDAEPEPHLRAAAEWLARAQDVTPDGGVSRGYSLRWHPGFKSRGWQPSYPETTGYIIPTFFALAQRHDEPAWRRRAIDAARWEVEVQLDSGAVQAGVVGQKRSPAAFNTGQVILGWIATYRETREEEFLEATYRAARFLEEAQSPDGVWRRGRSRFALEDGTLYNTRTGWALIEAGLEFGVRSFTAVGTRALAAAEHHQLENGWLPHCCLGDPQRPVLHTLAYAFRGLLEGGVLLDHTPFLESAARAARRLAQSVDSGGRMPGRYTSTWEPASEWACLTGQAQMVNLWLRLHEETGNVEWLEPAEASLEFLKSTQNRTSTSDGLRGGIKGSHPFEGAYGPFEVLNWATKFFVDALLRSEVAGSPAGESGGSGEPGHPKTPPIV